MSKTAVTSFSVILSLAVLAPLFNVDHFVPIVSFFMEALSVFFFGLCVLAFAFLAPRGARALASPWLFVAACTLLLFAQRGLGLYDYVDVPAAWLFFLFCFAALFFVGQVAGENPALRELLLNRLCWSVIIFALVNVGVQTLQAMGYEPLLVADNFLLKVDVRCRPGGNLGQSNHSSTFVLMALAAVLYLWRSVQQISYKCALPISMVLLLGLALSASRMAWVEMAVLGALIIARPAHLKLMRTQAVWAVSGFLLSFLLISQLPVLFFDFSNCQSGTARLLDGAAQGNWYRLELIRQAFTVWQSAPWFGVGLGKFMGTAYFLETRLAIQQPFDMYPHNLLLQVLAETGIVGLALLTSVSVLWGRAAWRALGTGLNTQNSGNWPMLVWVLVLCVHSLLEQPLNYSYFLLLFAVALGVLNAAPDAPKGIPLGKKFFAFCGLAMMVVAVLGTIDYQRTSNALNIMEMAAKAMPLRSDEGDALVENATANIVLFQSYLDFMRIPLRPTTMAALPLLRQEGLRVLRNLPQAVVISQQAALDAMAGDLASVDFHLRRLQAFYPKEANKYLEHLAKISREQPDLFKGLAEAAETRLKNPPQLRAPLGVAAKE